MSYRGFKRVLGETSLERKCRILFGISLLLLITGAFWYAERTTEKLVTERTRQTGVDFVDIALMRYHFDIWAETEEREDTDFAQEMSRDLVTQNYSWEILVLDKSTTKDKTDKTRLPKNDWEENLLLSLESEQNESLATFAREYLDSQLSNSSATAIEGSDNKQDVSTEIDFSPKSIDTVSHMEPVGNEYHYYQALFWRKSCNRCHWVLDKGDGVSTAEAHMLVASESPLRVVKVVIPNDETQRSMNKTRAILSATAIVTVFLAMVALYGVVRYVIVKPLTHLREISDEISRGELTRRAEIRTNDEFEDLANSFNRMLRHLVDAQQELQEANSSLDNKVDQLAQANMQLYEMNRLKSDFLANMSHELRTPLNSIIGFSDVLRTIDKLDEKQKRYVANIGSSGRVLLDMINDILDLAKMESGKMDVRLSEFRLGSVICSQCDVVRSLSEEKNIDLDVNVEPRLPNVYQDQGKIQQIVTNLLSNAIKFTPEGGRISVAVQRQDPDQFLISVTDTGVGIAEEDREIVFEKFRQGTVIQGGGDNLTREFSGTGLGLSIVKELCRLLGGHVSFTSELGKGSAFLIKLPFTLAERPRRESQLSNRVDDLVRAQRLETEKSSAGDGPVIQPAATSDSQPLPS